MIPFVKMHGIGNDFVLVDGIRHRLRDLDLASLTRAMCDRHFGIGADGLVVVDEGRASPLAMRMWNPDGSESEMCGNGIRCFARFALAEGLASARSFFVETRAGLLRLAVLDDGRVRVEMGRARFLRSEIGMTTADEDVFIEEPIEIEGFSGRATAVSMGNPHLVLFVDDASAIDLGSVGARLETLPLFPDRVNVHFVQVIDRRRLRQRTWERGAGATLACGTGACAAVAAAYRTSRAERQAIVELPGGELEIELGDDDFVWMTGPAETVFRGEWPS